MEYRRKAGLFATSTTVRSFVFDGNNLPVFAPIVNRDRLLGPERALEPF
jgi:hypothetical protein